MTDPQTSLFAAPAPALEPTDRRGPDGRLRSAAKPPPRPQEIHPHSRETYRAEVKALGERARRIVDNVKYQGRATDREIMERMGFSDMNMVRPRTTEAVKRGLLVECGERVCPVTGRWVRIVDVAERAQ